MSRRHVITCLHVLFRNLAIALIITFVPESLSAATLTLTPTIGATYDATTGANLGNVYIPGPYVYRFDIYVNISGLGPNETFGLVGFDVAIVGGGLTRNTLNIGGATTGLVNPKPNYVADSPPTSLFVSATGQPLVNYYTGGENGDLGSSQTDLIGMLTAIDASTLDGLEDAGGNYAPDPRLNIGKGSGTRIGAIYLRWDGVTTSLINLTSPLFATANTVTHQFSNTAPATVVPSVFPIPEPCSLVLAGVAAGGLLLLRRKGALRAVA